jgi:predicted TIM-barrel fold metal-dependent hydrolase
MFFEEMAAANIVSTVRSAATPKRSTRSRRVHFERSYPRPDAEVSRQVIGCRDRSHQQGARRAGETERCVRLGFKTIHIEPARSLDAMPNDPRIFPLYEKCMQPISVVMMTGPLAGPTIEYTNPVYIDDLARRFPTLKIVAGHGCWPWVTQILGVAFKHRNVFLCPDVYMFMPGADEYIRAADTYLQDQFLFGTAYPYRPLAQTAQEFLALPIRAEGWRRSSTRISSSC